MNALTAQQTALGAVNQELVANPFFGVITDPTSALSRATVTRGQLIRPFPQYTSVTAEFPSLGNLIYHALQAKVEKRFTRGHTLLGAYTWSKERHEIPMRLMRIDRENTTQGKTLFFWGVGKPIIHRGAAYFGFAKVRRTAAQEQIKVERKCRKALGS